MAAEDKTLAKVTKVSVALATELLSWAAAAYTYIFTRESVKLKCSLFNLGKDLNVVYWQN